MKILAVLFLFVLSSIVNGQEITFEFNPPDITFNEILKTDKITLVDGIKQKEDEITATMKIVLKKSNTGYRISKTPMMMNSKRDGEVFQNPIFMFLTNIATTGEIDKNGTLINVSGYESLIPRAKKELPAKVADAMMISANEEAMINKAKAEWNARISDFAGQSVQIGNMFSGEGKFPLPNGEKLTFFSVVKVADTVEFEGRKCVKIEFKNSSTPEDLALFMGYSVEETSQIFNFDANHGLRTSIILNGHGERIIDPNTMLIYSEKTFRRVEMKTEEMGDESKTITTLETKEYIYEY
ncbi:hypothetical protein ACFLSQ_00200 [Bacteroidota bacterium]